MFSVDGLLSGLTALLASLPSTTEDRPALTNGPVHPHFIDCPVQPPDEYLGYYIDAALKHPGGPDACQLVRQGYQESRFDPEAKSPVGAVGLAQFLPSTAADIGIDPLDPEEAIEGQAEYMRRLMKQWHPDLGGRDKLDIWMLGLISYNWGLKNVLDNQRRHGWILFSEAYPYLPHETQVYVKHIAGYDDTNIN